MKKIMSFVLAAALSASLCVPVAAASGSLSNFTKVREYTSGQFTDVTPDNTFATNIQAVYEYGIMGGKTSSMFDATGNLTVAQAIVMASRLHSIYMNDGVEFETSTPWYQAYLDYAMEEKILTKGFDAYDVPVTRQVFTEILGGALPDSALKAINTVEDKAIPDVDPDDAAVYRLYRAGIITGNDGKGTFAPDANITRGAAAAIMARMANPDLRKTITLKEPKWEPTPIDKLANLTSLKKKCTDAEFQEAYDVAVELMRPYAKSSKKEQLSAISSILRKMVDSGKVTYTTDVAHYNDPYGYFVAGVSSCAGCTRATGLCLNILGIPYEHVNENQWSHQWCRVEVDGEYWICDAYGLYCGKEPAPYQHPYIR